MFQILLRVEPSAQFLFHWSVDLAVAQRLRAAGWLEGLDGASAINICYSLSNLLILSVNVLRAATDFMVSVQSLSVSWLIETSASRVRMKHVASVIFNFKHDTADSTFITSYVYAPVPLCTRSDTFSSNRLAETPIRSYILTVKSPLVLVYACEKASYTMPNTVYIGVWTL